MFNINLILDKPVGQSFTVILVDEKRFNKEDIYNGINYNDVFLSQNFKAKKNDIFTCFLNKCIYIGVKDISDVDDYREIGALLVKEINKFPVIESISFEGLNNSNVKELFSGIGLSNYSFDKYKTDSKDDNTRFVNFYFSDTELFSEASKIETFCSVQNLARDILNDCPTQTTQELICKTVKDNLPDNLDLAIYSEDNISDSKNLLKLGMNGLLAVNRASIDGALVLKLTYTPKDYKKHIVVCGKGVVYDTGGLSIKNNMCKMKYDKAGAIVSFAAMLGLSEIGSENKVTVYMGLVENAIGSKAYKPDEIITMKNGKTVLIENTDAEGRLVLADLLALSQEENEDIDELYTIATLTGASARSFGDKVAAMVGFNEDIKMDFKKTALQAGEIFVNTELHKHLLDEMKCDIADLSNMSKTQGIAGTQTAGLFLTHFVTEKNIDKFVHLDIAAPSYVSSPFRYYNCSGVTGFGTGSLLNRFLK